MRRVRPSRASRIAPDQLRLAAAPQNGDVFQTENIVNAPILVSFDGSASAQRAAALLATAAAHLERERVPHETHVAWGEAAACIARAARRLKCGSIVMGTRGMGAFGNLLLGSTATKLVHLSSVPVTLVKPR
jgi:nucleotide-binding universal stress UspA family protein